MALLCFHSKYYRSPLVPRTNSTVYCGSLRKYGSTPYIKPLSSLLSHVCLALFVCLSRRIPSSLESAFPLTAESPELQKPSLTLYSNLFDPLSKSLLLQCSALFSTSAPLSSSESLLKITLITSLMSLSFVQA